MYRRLGVDDVPAHDHGQGRQQPDQIPPAQLLPQHTAQGREAHVDPGHEQHQAQIGVGDADQDAQQAPALELQGKELEQQEKANDGQQRQGHLCHLVGDGPEIVPADLHRGGRAARIGSGGLPFPGAVEKAEDHHRQDGTDGAERHQAEAVGLGVLIASYGGNAHAQGHDEGDGHGPGGDTAGIKSDGQKPGVHKAGQGENDRVEKDQQQPQRHGNQNPQHTQGQKSPHTQGHGGNEHRLIDPRHIGGQHLQIRLRHGDSCAQQEAQKQDQAQLP